MNWAAKYQPKRSQYWPEVEQYFGNLPSPLFRQGVLLKNNLAISYSDTGQFADILGRDHDHPLLYLHFWLFDDFRFLDTAGRIELEKHLFLAMTFTFAAVHTHESILDEGTSFDNQYLFLERALTQQADFHLARLYPGTSPFWGHYQAFWGEYTEAVLTAADLLRPQGVLATVSASPPSGPRSPAPGLQPPASGPWSLEEGLVAGKLAFAKIPLAAVAISAGQSHAIPQLCAMMDRLNLIFQIRRDLSTIRCDLMRGNYTYPIVRTMRAAGLDPQQPVIPERILGALVLTDSIEQLCQESLAHLHVCRATARELDLPTFASHFAVIEDLIASMRDLFSLKAKPVTVKESASRPKKPKRAFFKPYVDTLGRAVAMAEAYLLSDLTFRESWEVQRGNLLNVSELVAKAFPAGLIIELLCRHGQDLSTQVDQVFQTLQETGFRYYDYAHLPPDADDLGLLLRLYRYSTPGQRAAHRNLLQTPLRWLEKNILPSGEIPVWFKQNAAAEDEDPPSVLIWGNSCATTETNLLFGLIDYDRAAYDHIIEKSALSLLDRFITNGLGATLYYVPPYILWATFTLMAQLSAEPIQETLQVKLDQASALLLERLELETKRRTITPQDAAFLILTCLPPPTNYLFDERWLTVLLKSQRYDGSWDDEPIFLIPGQGGSAWYSSRPVTTAFCYHALKTYQETCHLPPATPHFR